MAFTQNDLSGSLFKNDRKETETHADYAGSCLIHGEEFWMNAWLKTSKDGKKFMSFSFRPKKASRPQANPRQEAPKAESTGDGWSDDDVAF